MLLRKSMCFEDTWHWVNAADTYHEFILLAPTKVRVLLEGLLKILGTSDMMAYIAMMAPRLVEMKRILKQTGSLYLHCDPTASHYLKILLDAVFGAQSFRNEIIWQRTTNTGSSKAIANKFSADTDTILFYTKSKQYTFNRIYHEYEESYLARFKYEDERGKFRCSLSRPIPRDI